MFTVHDDYVSDFLGLTCQRFVGGTLECSAVASSG